jgi:hypothetical protein
MPAWTTRRKKPKKKPDGRGERPRDPNQLARWIVEQSTTTTETKPSQNKPA